MAGLLFGPPKAEACCTYAQNPPRYRVDHTRKLVRPRARNLFLPPPHFNLLPRPDAPHGANGALVAGTTPKSIRVASFETSARLAFRFSRPLVTSHPTFRDTSSTGLRFWELESWVLPPARTVCVGNLPFLGPSRAQLVRAPNKYGGSGTETARSRCERLRGLRPHFFSWRKQITASFTDALLSRAAAMFPELDGATRFALADSRLGRPGFRSVEPLSLGACTSSVVARLTAARLRCHSNSHKLDVSIE